MEAFLEGTGGRVDITAALLAQAALASGLASPEVQATTATSSDVTPTPGLALFGATVTDGVHEPVSGATRSTFRF